MKNKKYWIERAKRLDMAVQKDAGKAVSRITDAYARAIESINSDIKKVLRGMSSATGIIDEKELRELINSRQKNELYGDLKRIYDTTEDARLKDECAKKINAMAYGHRVDRLEAVKTKIYAEMKKAQEIEQSTHTALHTNTVQKAYRESIASLTKGLDITGSFSQLPRNAIKEMLSKPWLGSNYSSRIWNNNDQFIRKVQTVVENGVTNGHSVSRMADKLTSFIAEPCQGQRYIAERLVRTETAHFMNQGQLRAYKDIGIKQYQYVCAFSEATCDMCGNLDGEIINIDAAIEGDNYPPLHPNCRCTTVIAGYDPDTRIVTDPETGENYKVSGNTTFNEWKKTVDFGGKSGIIKEEAHRALQVSTGGRRNEEALTEKQLKEAVEYAVSIGMPRERIYYVEYDYTAYGVLSDILRIGTDVYPSAEIQKNPNCNISMRGAIAHEVIGHRGAALAGKTQADNILEEVQASLRASTLTPDLSSGERLMLARDALYRLHNSGRKLREVKKILYLE